MRKLTITLMVIAAVGLLAGTAGAAVISVTGSKNASYNDATSDTFNYTVQNSDSQLVIGFYVDSADTVTSLSFGGTAADGYFQNERVTIGYWDNPATGSASLEISGISGAFGGPDLHVGAYELANVDLSASVNSSSGNTITTTTDNEFVISFAGNNGNGTHSPTASSIIDTGVFTRDDDDLPFGSQSGGGSVGGGGGQAGTAGSQDVSWDNGAVVNYSFTPIPEPASVLLLVAAFAGIGVYRKKFRR